MNFHNATPPFNGDSTPPPLDHLDFSLKCTPYRIRDSQHLLHVTGLLLDAGGHTPQTGGQAGKCPHNQTSANNQWEWRIQCPKPLAPQMSQMGWLCRCPFPPAQFVGDTACIPCLPLLVPFLSLPKKIACTWIFVWSPLRSQKSTKAIPQPFLTWNSKTHLLHV